MLEELRRALNEPVTFTIVVLAGTVLILAILGAVWRRRREAAAYARRRADLRKHYGAMQMQQAELERLSARILATSSTATIAGFAVVRQIETIFSDGHPSQNKAVQVLKALAAEKGANAIINLTSQRLPSGKCQASGDAVIVRVEAENPTPTAS